MQDKTNEHYFTCPYCGAGISMVLDLSIKTQTYIEDCEVCCKPIEIQYRVSHDDLSEFMARSLDE